MAALYLFTAIVGWLFVAIFVFFGADADIDADVDFDADLDLDVDADLDLETTFWSDFAGDYLSIRGLVFFLAGFGLTGFVLDVILGVNALLSFLLAILMGVLGAFLNGQLKKLVRKDSADSNLRLADLRGALGQVVLPVKAESRGRITLEVAGHKRYMVARPYREGPDLEVGQKVVVIDVEGATALVAPENDTP